MSVSRRLRFEVLRRDNYTCRYCGAKAPDATLTVDHVIPTTLGGGDEPNNLATACTDCNSGKSSIPADAALVEDVDAAAMLWARASEMAADRRLAEMDDLREKQSQFYERWASLYSYVNNDHLPSDWAGSIATFLGRGLTIETLLELAYAPMDHRIQRYNSFRYFAGACWQEITKREELTRRLIEDGEV